MRKQPFKWGDLFCGCGGMATGGVRALDARQIMHGGSTPCGRADRGGEMNDTLFDMPEAKEPPLRLRADKPVYNYRRIRFGQNLKVNLRDCRTGKIVATIYGGERMAAQIVEAVNEREAK